ncbi:MAG: nucleotidyltransferase family protein [Deltaproteobacteria bacterium]|nr:nucleotidyltransferase family protein [Deltaproteobacteria bacterium]
MKSTQIKNPPQALILAAGFGTRLRPFTNHYPKPMVPILDIPLILYTLTALKQIGIKDIIINLHHQGNKLKKFLGNGAALGLNIVYSNESKILGTGGGIKKVLRYVKDDLLIVNGDIVFDLPLKDLIALHHEGDFLATLGLYNHPRKKDFGLLRHKNKQLTAILGEPEQRPSDSSAMFSGIHLVNKASIQKLMRDFPANEFFCIVRQIYQPALAQKMALGALELQGYWDVCDRLEDVRRVEKTWIKTPGTLPHQKATQTLAKKLKIPEFTIC